MKAPNHNLTDRELSWLSFSERILQEARDPRVPLYDRIKFLAIFSSNLDEYFRVRIASIRSLLDLKKKTKKKLGIDPAGLLDEIRKIVQRQQEEFGSIFRKQVIPELRSHGVFLTGESEIESAQRRFALGYFKEHVESLITPFFIAENKEAPFLQNKGLYLAVKLRPRTNPIPASGKDEDGGGYKFAIVEIPSQRLPRFIVVPEKGKGTHILFLDDVVRISLPEIFPRHEVISAYSIKLSRDADLYLWDEFAGNLLEKIKLGLSKRKDGAPCRFLYDADMPKKFLRMMREVFSLSKEDLVAGGRYHNFNDLIDLPNPGGAELSYEPMPPLPHRNLDSYPTMFESIRNKDSILAYPYQSYEYVIRFLQEAARDPSVTSLQITLYRVAQNSQIVNALLEAAARGKAVTAFVELKARFDEESNLHWAEELEKAGVRVLYSFPGLKVHAKLCLVSSSLGDRAIQYAYLGTGNFNERTAKAYADLGFFTADERLTKDVHNVFEFLAGNSKRPHCENLLVAPFSMRERFIELVDREIKHASQGQPAYMILKMNSLEDSEMIEKLYEASIEGVKVWLIVRGVCCLIPGLKRISENITAVSIIDRFLEHSRVYIFHSGGEEQCYLSSADWMVRNLSRRVEVAFPIFNIELKNEIRKMIDLQLQDNTKARIIFDHRDNQYKRSTSRERIRSQTATYEFLRQQADQSSNLAPLPLNNTGLSELPEVNLSRAIVESQNMKPPPA
ncbi:MAG TPA: polyphosphate kinase 1 [Bacteroidota bacterium]|nr:polyphosphate kinase 1 [Bacteroidota bacterium]